jgi:hypothetical protein
MSGGYASEISDTVEIHCNTIRAAHAIFDSAVDSESSVNTQTAAG